VSPTTAQVGPVPTPAPAARHPAAAPVPGVPDPDAIAAAVLGCRDVRGLSGGQFGEVATYLPGRRVIGVRVTSERVVVHVVVRYGPPLQEVGDRIHRVLAPHVLGLPVDVVIDDVERG
jgi:hypothetical protein